MIHLASHLAQVQLSYGFAVTGVQLATLSRDTQSILDSALEQFLSFYVRQAIDSV